MPTSSSVVPPVEAAADRPRSLPVGYAALAGALSGAIAVGIGLLVGRLLLLATGRGAAGVVDGTPSWLWWLSNQFLGSNQPGLLVVIAGIVTIVVGAVAGLLSRRRTWPGIALFAVCAIVAMWQIWSANTGAVDLLVPVLGAAAGIGALVVFVRTGHHHWSTAAAPAVPGAEPFADDVTAPHGGLPGAQQGPAGRHRMAPPTPGPYPGGPPPQPPVQGGPPPSGTPSGRGLTPRRAVLVGTLLAVGTGAAGALIRGPQTQVIIDRGGPQPPTLEPLVRGTVVDVKTFGATGDGNTNDAPAIRRALDQVNSAGGTLFFPAGTYKYQSTTALNPGTGVTVSGVPGQSIIDFASGTSGFLLGVAIVGNDITIDGITLRRAGDFDAVLISTGAFQRFTFSRSELVGNMDTMPGKYCHGFKLSDQDTSSGLNLVDSTFTTLQYGLFQTNQSTAVTTDIKVERCKFSGSHNTDLEFNSPKGETRNVLVQGCSFADNDSPGFGVGLANVQGVEIRDNTFHTYAMEAVHVEDYSADVVVTSNEFTACGLRKHSFVQIISGASRVQVAKNTFRATANSNEIFVVTAQPGGQGQTVSGRPVIAPSGINVQDNTFDCSAAVTPIYFQGATGSSITGSTITGPDLTDPQSAFQLPGSADTMVGENSINGTKF